MQNPAMRQESKMMLAGVEVRKDDIAGSRGKRKPRNYKPNAMRPPVLIIFALLLLICIGLIETILHMASSPAASRATVETASTVVQKRATSTATEPAEALTTSRSTFATTRAAMLTLTSTQMPSGTFMEAMLTLTSSTSTPPLATTREAMLTLTSNAEVPATQVMPEAPTNQGIPDRTTKAVFNPVATVTAAVVSEIRNLLTTTITSKLTSSTVLQPNSSLSIATAGKVASSTVSNLPIATLSSTEKILDRTFDKFSYFAAVYLPPLVAIIIKVMWEIIYSSFKMMEPFQRLCKPGGASAQRTLFSQYLSNSVSLDAVKACFDGRSLPLATTIVYSCVAVLTTLAAASMTVRATDTCEVEPGEFMRCDPVWVVNVAIIRCIEVLLLISTASILGILLLMRSYKSGVSSNPSSIVTIAGLANQEALLQDFRTLDPLAGGAKTAAALQHRKCQLHYHENTSGDIHYGIGRVLMPDFYMTQQYHQASANSFQKWSQGYSAVSNPASTTQSLQKQELFSRSMRLKLTDCLQLLSSAGLLGVVTAYRYDFNNDSFNNFFNSRTFYAEIVFVGIASLVDMQWKRLEREVRITEPYRRMAQGFERPETTVLMTLNGTCWSTLPNTVRKLFKFRRMWFQSLVSMVAILSDFNIIAVVGVIYSDAQIWPIFYTSAIVAMIITSLMVVVMLITIFWWRRGVAGTMPRTPDTIGNILSYLCASRLTRELSLAQQEDLSQKERDEMLIATGWRFSFGWKAGIDGRERWTVDYDSSSNVPRSER